MEDSGDSGSAECVVCPERANEAVIAEGGAERVTDSDSVQRFRLAYDAKYGEGVDTDLLPVHAMRPVVAFGFTSDAIEYPRTATRWRCDER
jgi:hypothetical protein